MRMMIQFLIPVEFGNSAIRSGQLEVTQQLSEDLNQKLRIFTLSMASGAGFDCNMRSCRKFRNS